jgi:hypothetical protein
VHLGLVNGLLDEVGQPRKVRVIPVLDGSGPCLVRIGAPTEDRASDVLELPAGPASAPQNSSIASHHKEQSP